VSAIALTRVTLQPAMARRRGSEVRKRGRTLARSVLWFDRMGASRA
jgi:hypothetical protein